MRGIRDEDFVSGHIAAREMVSAHHQDSGEFAVRAGRGLQADSGEAANLFQPFLQLVHQRKAALHRIRFLQRVGVEEPGQPRSVLVDARVVFHSA